jgi:hypothetical protein
MLVVSKLLFYNIRILNIKYLNILNIIFNIITELLYEYSYY